MGADASCFLVLGIPARRADFFTDEGEVVRCQRGHVSSGEGKFCPKDGTPFKAARKERMTEALKAWGAKQDYEDPWDALCDTYGSTGLGLHGIAPVQSSEDTNREFALGYRLRESGQYKRVGSPLELSEINELSEKLIAEAAELGIKGTPKLFLCLYWSV